MLVSVGIPAYDRPEELERAVRSALAQTHTDLEVIVSDDASPNPAVAHVAQALAAADERVRFTRQPRNLGHDGNYDWVARQARGEVFMWLSDDDHMAPDYVARCLDGLAQPGTVLAYGRVSYHRDGAHAVDERPISITGRRPGLRVLHYFATVSVNGPLFGLRRRELVAATPFPPVPGGDWLLVAATAARGRVRCVEGAVLHRSIAGLGSDPEALGRSFGLSGALARHHHVLVARSVQRAIAREDAYAAIPRAGRHLTGALAALLIVLRFPVADLARRLPVGRLEERATAFIRRRD